MRPAFNVLNQGWIPVINGDGDRELLGIRETLARAHELKEISDPSPLEEYSVYRFLGLFLMDALRPKKKSSIRAILQAGRFDMEQIEAYIAQCQAEGVSFDIFDEARPFLQSKFESNEKTSIKPAFKIDCTYPAETGHTHFVHDPVDNSMYQPDKAFRLVLASYVFCFSAGRGYYYSVYGAPPLFGVIMGHSLFETLVATLLPIDQLIPFDDSPVLWRNRFPIVSGKKVSKVSWLQGMLFPARMIQLIPNLDGTVSEVFYMGGEKFENPDSWIEPYATRRLSKGELKPILPMERDAIWRNISDIINIKLDHASPLLKCYESLHKYETTRIALYGILAEEGKAKVLMWCRYDLSLPCMLIEDEEIEKALKDVITRAEQIRNALLFSFERPKEKDLKRSANSEFFLDESFERRYNRQNVKNIIYWAPSYAREKVSARFDAFCQEQIMDICSNCSSKEELFLRCVSFKKDAIKYAVKIFEDTFSGTWVSAGTQALLVNKEMMLKKILYMLVKQ